MEGFKNTESKEASNARYYRYKNVDLEKFRTAHQFNDISQLETELASAEAHLKEVLNAQPDQMTMGGEMDGNYFVNDEADSSFGEYAEMELEIAMTDQVKKILKELIAEKEEIKKAA